MLEGFYYHYKRDPSDSFEKGAYEVLGTAFNTEGPGFHSTDAKDFEETEVVVYRPLFKDSLVYKTEKRFWIRPRSMFTETIEYNGRKVQRFQKISNPELVGLLTAVAKELYS